MLYTPYSFSKVETYKTCPYKFKQIYIDKNRYPSDSIALVKGSYIHKRLENFGDKKIEFNSERMTPELQEEWDNIYENFRSSPLSEKFLDSPYIGLETKFGLDNNINPCGYYSKRAVLRGAIDRMQIDGDVLELVDFKSGKLKQEQYQTNDQVMLYAIWGFKQFPEINTIKGCYVYVEHNISNDFVFKRQYLPNYVKTYAERLKGIESDLDFVKTPSRLCPYCEYLTNNECEGNK